MVDESEFDGSNPIKSKSTDDDIMDETTTPTMEVPITSNAGETSTSLEQAQKPAPSTAAVHPAGVLTRRGAKKPDIKEPKDNSK